MLELVHVGERGVDLEGSTLTFFVMANSMGRLLRLNLSATGWTQPEAGKRLGCSDKHLNQVMQGRQSLSVDLALACERVFEQPGLAEQLLMSQVRDQLDQRRQSS